MIRKSIAVAFGIFFLLTAVVRAESLSGRLYFHDQGQLTNAKEAQEKFNSAREGMNDLWDVLLSNQSAGFEGNRTRLETSARIRFEAFLVAVDELEWEEIWKCGEGICEDISSLDAFVDNITEKEKNALKSLYPKGTTAERLKSTLGDIKMFGEQIQKLTNKIENDPDGSKELGELPAGKVDKPLEDLKIKIATTLDQLDQRSAGLRKKIVDALDAANDLIENSDEIVGKIFTDGNAAIKRADSVLDVLRSKDAMEALKEGPLKTAIEKGRKAELPEAFRAALKADVKDDKGNPLEVATVGELLDFLSSEQAAIEEIRLSLLQDMRANLVEIRAARLNELKAKLRLKKRLAEIQTAQLSVEKGISLSKTRITGYKGYKPRVVDSLEAMHRRYQQQSDNSKQDILDQFSDVVLYLAKYTERIGYLRDSEKLLQLEESALDHQLSIERSRIAAAGREAMIARGLEGIVSFTEGGITSEDVAGVIRLINTGLLTVIAATN